MLAALIAQILHAVLLTAIAPGVAGFVQWIEARLTGHRGAPIAQPYADLARLLRKEAVMPESASPASAAALPVAFAALALALLLVPSFALGMISAPGADLILIAGLALLARAAEAIAALDTGTGTRGTAAGQAAAARVLAEPALLAAIVALALLAGTTNLNALAGDVRAGAFGAHPALLLALAALIPAGLADFVAVPESGEVSGRMAALARMTAMARLLFWLALIAAIALPFGDAAAGGGPVAWLAGIVLWLAKIAVLAALLALARACLPRLTAARLPELLAAAAVLGLLAASFVFARMGPA